MSGQPNGKPAKPKCVVPGCGDDARWKGVCGKCYHQARTLIGQGKTTWEGLAEMGLCTIEDKKLLTAFLAKKSVPEGRPEGRAVKE